MRVQLESYSPAVRADVLVVGGGTAGCVLAARLSEASDRQVCLVEAGPDYGPLAEGRWPPEILDPRALPTTHGWGTGGEDGRPLGGRILGGSSAVNGCMVLAGSPADYDEWGTGWSYDDLYPHLERATATLRTAEWNADHPTPFQAAFVEAAVAAGFPLLADPSDPASPVGVAASPRNVADGMRWNTALAYLEEARARPNLTIVADTLVDRVLFEGSTVTGVATEDGRRLEAGSVILAAGAYFSPAILLRSGIGPEGDLRELDIPVVEALPVGECLLDHCGMDVAWELTEASSERTAADAEANRPLRGSRGREGREHLLHPGQLGSPSPALGLPRLERRWLPGQRDRLPHEAALLGASPRSLDRPCRAPGRRAWLPLASGGPPAAARGHRARPPDRRRRAAS